MIDEYIKRHIEAFHRLISDDIKSLRDSERKVRITSDSGIYTLFYDPRKNKSLVILYDYEGVMFELCDSPRHSIKNEDSTVYFFENNTSREIQVKLLLESIRD